MAAYFRTDDNRFVYTQRNQRGIKMLYFIDNFSYTIVPDRLVANINGGFFRYFNFGDDYTHLHNFWMVGGSLEAYLGRWTLTAQAMELWHTRPAMQLSGRSLLRVLDVGPLLHGQSQGDVFPPAQPLYAQGL